VSKDKLKVLAEKIEQVVNATAETQVQKKKPVKVVFDKTELRTEADVNDYVEALKKAMLKQINENRRISL
jgi:hypothetical protein